LKYTEVAPKSVAGYFVGRYNRERRKSLAFLNRSHQECMHSTEGLLFCWLAKAHDVKGAFSQENGALGEQAAQTRSTLSQGRLFAIGG